MSSIKNAKHEKPGETCEKLKLINSKIQILEPNPITYIRTLVLRIKLEFRHDPDRWREIYQNKPLNTECYVFHYFLVDLRRIAKKNTNEKIDRV